jgi:hypothetical protein
MKAWALSALLASSGCLFLDGVNRPPTLTMSATITTTVKGASLALTTDARDPEDDPADVTVSFAVYDANSGALADPLCDYERTQLGHALDIRFFRSGIFRVDAVAADSHHAISGTASTMVTITDAPPVFADKSAVLPTSTPDACNLNAAGDVVTLGLSGSVTDADAAVRGGDPSCPPAERLTYTWRIVDAPTGSAPRLTSYDGGCAAATATSGPTLAVAAPTAQVCLWTDPTLTGATALYTVVLDVSDGTTTVTSPAGEVPVSADAPPCITGTNPIAGSYIVDRSELQRFDIDGVLDDRDAFGTPGITFAWSVWREADPVWREVPSWPMSTYQLDVSSFGVGETVRVRAEALDRTAARAPASLCAVDADDCSVASCAAAPAVCHKWKTWNLELR